MAHRLTDLKVTFGEESTLLQGIGRSPRGTKFTLETVVVPHDPKTGRPSRSGMEEALNKLHTAKRKDSQYPPSLASKER